MRRSIAALIALSAVAACAPTEGRTPEGRFATSADGPRQCFEPRRVTNFRRGETDQQVYVRVLGGGVFEIASGGCFDLGSTNGLAITPSIGISDRLCVGDGANITVLNSTAPQGPCLARVVRSLSEAEIEALPGRQRP